MREQRQQYDSGEVSRRQTAGPGAMFKPVVFVLRAKRNHENSVRGRSGGENEVGMS